MEPGVRPHGWQIAACAPVSVIRHVQNQSITWRRRWLLDCHNLRKVNEPRGHAIWIAAIIAVSALLGMLVDWRAPGIERYTRDWLMQVRGQLPPPDDIAIVAI